jgi:hypothetical protein
VVVTTRALLTAVVALASAACGAPEPPANTGGTDVAPGACGRGVVVVSSDYQSTDVGLVDWSGDVLSASVISSSSASTGLSAALSGDVVAPTTPDAGDTFTLIDRYPASVITLVDVVSGAVRAQIDVKTGFASDAHDWLALGDHKAYVARYDPNLAAGAEPFDGGSDVLIVDPIAGAPTGRIDLSSALAGAGAGFYPRPARLVQAGGLVYALLSCDDLDYTSSAESRVVEIDPATDAITRVHVLSGLHGCLGLAVSPSGASLGVACSGQFEQSSATDVGESAAVRLDLTTLDETARATAASLGGDALGFSISFASESTAVVTTFGALGGATPHGDRALLVDLDAATSREISSTADAFKLGEARCAQACGACFLADASTAESLVRFDAAGRAAPTSIEVDPAVGLPAVYLGAF